MCLGLVLGYGDGMFKIVCRFPEIFCRDILPGTRLIPVRLVREALDEKIGCSHHRFRRALLLVEHQGKLRLAVVRRQCRRYGRLGEGQHAAAYLLEGHL